MTKSVIAPKKERNALIDVFKVFNTAIICLGHFFSYFYSALTTGPAGGPAVYNPQYQGSLIYMRAPEIWGMTGYLVISYFTFMTGYWFISAFKRNQAKGLHGRGKDSTVIFKYWVKQYSAYMPYIALGVLSTILTTYILVPQLQLNDIKGLFSNILSAVPQMLGIYGLGFDGAGYGYGLVSQFEAATEGFTLSMADCVITWQAPLWYMSAIIIGSAIMYYVFLKSEIVGLSFVTPLLLTLYYTAYTRPEGIHFFENFALDNIPIRLWGEAAYGIYGWYIVDAIKKRELTKKETTALTILSIGSLGCYIFYLVTACGGTIVSDFTIAAFLITALALKDPFTITLNNICKRIPGIQYAGVISMSLYILHYPLQEVLGYCVKLPEYAWLANFMGQFSLDVQALIWLIANLIITIPYYFVDKHVLQKITLWIRNITNFNEPIVFDDLNKAN